MQRSIPSSIDFKINTPEVLQEYGKCYKYFEELKLPKTCFRRISAPSNDVRLICLPVGYVSENTWCWYFNILILVLYTRLAHAEAKAYPAQNPGMQYFGLMRSAGCTVNLVRSCLIGGSTFIRSHKSTCSLLLNLISIWHHSFGHHLLTLGHSEPQNTRLNWGFSKCT